jgi:hypothetical protein
MARIAALSAAGRFSQEVTTFARSGQDTPEICARICVQPFEKSCFCEVSEGFAEGSNPFARSSFSSKRNFLGFILDVITFVVTLVSWFWN